MLTLFIQEMSKAFPTLMETLLHERDMLVLIYLTSYIYCLLYVHGCIFYRIVSGKYSC